MFYLVNAWQLVGHGGRLPRQSWHGDTARVKALRKRRDVQARWLEPEAPTSSVEPTTSTL
jgi:transposase